MSWQNVRETHPEAGRDGPERARTPPARCCVGCARRVWLTPGAVPGEKRGQRETCPEVGTRPQGGLTPLCRTEDS